MPWNGKKMKEKNVNFHLETNESNFIAATELHYNAELITVNTKDFIHIPNLKITNPIEK